MTLNNAFRIIPSTSKEIVESSPTDLYQYRVFIGAQTIYTDKRSSYWYIDRDKVWSVTGNGDSIVSETMCVEIFGYTPESRSSTYSRSTDLPYINGCSTKQLINAVRPGDPTFQMLHIPAGTSEQAHHIHATPRVVYVTAGSGRSIVGTPGSKKVYDLNQGDVIILGKMVPHHFETKKNSLTVLPVHVYSSVGQQEFDHPMYAGTHKT
jgi:quercetin dioxygenase-like cupin family protein